MTTAQSTAARQHSGDLIFATATAVDAETGRLGTDIETVTDEGRVALTRIRQQLEEEGLGFHDVVKASCYVADESHRMELIGTFKDMFAPGPFPSRVTFTVGLIGQARVQVDVVAYREASKAS